MTSPLALPRAVAARISSLRPRWQHLLAVGAYLAIVLLLLGGRLVPRFAHGAVAVGDRDAAIFVWSLRWWPHAIGHFSDPLFTRLLFAPTGVDLAWATTIPGPAFLLSPLTLGIGAVRVFDLLEILAPVLAAWSAFALCRRLTNAFLPSLAGGFFFGFSAYEISELGPGHLNLSLVFLVPVLAYLFVRRVEGSLGGAAFVAWFAAALLLEFTISLEVFATATGIGVVVGLGGLAFVGRDLRRRLLEAAGLALLSYAIAAVVATPYIVALVAHPRLVRHFAPDKWSNDLAHLALPGNGVRIGFGSLRNRVAGWRGFPGAYLSVPILAMIVLACATAWRRAAVRLGAVAFVVAVVASLGPTLRVGGTASIAMPWRAVLDLPLLRNALPGRIVVFAWLAAAVVVAVTLSRPARWVRGVGWALAVAAAILILPSTSSGRWLSHVPEPPFITTGQYRTVIPRGATIVVVSVREGDQEVWQAQTDFWYRIAGGYIGGTPPDFEGAGLALNLSRSAVRPFQRRFLLRYLKEHGARYVMAEEATARTLRLLTGALGGPPRSIGGVRLYTVP